MRERPLKNVGLHLAAQTPIGAMGLLDYLIVTSDTVGHGFQQLARYLRLLTGAPFLLELREDQDPILAVYHVDSSATFGVEYSIALTVSTFARRPATAQVRVRQLHAPTR